MVSWIMTIIWSLLIILTPFLFGGAIAGIFREKNAGVFEKFAYGFLSLLLVSFGITLVTLKFRVSFDKFSMLTLLVWGLALAVGIVSFVAEIKGKVFTKKPFDKFSLWYIIPAVILGVYAYIYLAPSFANDDTWEIVSTTVKTGAIYEYSAMTGAKMVNGLPIFNKIYFLPLLYAAFVNRLGIPMNYLGGILIPGLVYTANLGLVKTIGEKVRVKNLSSFMILYMLTLMGGTYLPQNGIPATFGYGILREGYSGYGVFYGVLIPTVVLLLIKKKWLMSVFMAVVSVGLLRLDRIFFSLKTPVTTWGLVNSEGKMALLTIAAVAAAFFLKALKKADIQWKLVLCPPAFLSCVVDSLVVLVAKKRDKKILLLGIGFVILVACNFEPFKESQTFSSYLKYEKEVAEELSKLETEDCCILAPLEFMSVARRLNGGIRTLYGRDDVSPYMVGLDYEDTSEYVTYYYRYTLNKYLLWEPYYIPYEEEELLDYARKDGMDYLILP